MGLQDRQYYQEDTYSSPWNRSSSAGSYGQRSMVTTLIIVNVVVFGLDTFSSMFSADGQCWLARFLALKAGSLSSQPWNIWQLFTYGFAHASIDSDLFHIAGNMLILFFLGRPIEDRLGSKEFLKFYLISIVVAGLVYLLLNFSNNSPMLGASGAVSAVVALFIFYYPHSTLLLFGVLPIRAWILGVILVGTDVLRSFSENSHVAWEAHLAGFAFGAAYYYLKWNFSGLKFGGVAKAIKPKPNLKIHRPNKAEQLKQEADRILEKINVEGESSLSAKERKILQRYSEQIRNDRG